MKEKNGEHPYGDLGQLIVLGLFVLIWAVDSFILHLSTFLAQYIPIYIRLPIMAFMILLALYLSNQVHKVLFHGQRPEAVVDTGVFRWIRHPMYLASLLVCLGLAISTASLLSLAAFLGVLAFFNYIANYEEKLLEEKFWEEYLEYRNKTGKWLPKLLSMRKDQTRR